MERLSIWFQPRHSSIDITTDAGVKHETSGTTMTQVLNDLRPEDKAIIRTFCDAMLRCLGGDCAALNVVGKE